MEIGIFLLGYRNTNAVGGCNRGVGPFLLYAHALQTSLLPGRSQKNKVVLIVKSLLKPFQEGLELTGLEKAASGRAKARAKVLRIIWDFGIIFP
jgi:hypothetical protein